MADLLRGRLHAAGIYIGGSTSHIVSVFFRGQGACSFYDELRRRRILTSVFVYPATPRGISLARFSVYADLTEADVHYIADSTIQVLAQLEPLTAMDFPHLAA
jgi:7-keto-8-aminopelargonate synthetase-like enzyme